MHLLKFKRILTEYFEKSNVNINAFERSAGLGRGIIQKILGDQSKNPTIENILKIADELHCSIDELFDREEFFKEFIKKKRSKLLYDQVLLQVINNYINNYIEVHKIKNVDFGMFLYLLEEIYEYSIITNNNKFDEKFSSWLLKNQL